MYDLILRGGTVFDGSGSPAAVADVAIQGDRIAAVGALPEVDGRVIRDVTGLVVSPGFVDTHTHMDGALLTDPIGEPLLRQGVTTAFLGLDGMSYAPLSLANFRLFRQWLSGLLGLPPLEIETESVERFRRNYHERASLNTAYLIPLGAIRLQAVGFRDRPLTGPALRRAKRLVEDGFADGAVGFSTGSAYYPGPWSDTQELVELAEVVSRAGAVFVNEPRKRNLERAVGGDGLQEALDIARRAHVKIHIAHYRTSPETAGRVDELMAPFDQAIGEGVDCSFDVYPYPTGSSILVSRLAAAFQEGGPPAILRRLRNKNTRQAIAADLDVSHGAGLATAVLTYVWGAPDLEGRSLLELGREHAQTPGEILVDLLLAAELGVGYLVSPPADLASWRQVSEDCVRLLSRPDYMVCSDITPAGQFCHPRAYGAFPRFIGRLGREFPFLSLGQMIQRMTSKPAQRFGLTDRGWVKPGAFADIVAFDEGAFVDTATYDDPVRLATGVVHLVVNGQLVIDNGQVTRTLAGRAIP
jgi:N-acyl-D-amino-acid deacylase